MSNKKAEIGMTMTWIIATIIIFVILIVFLFAVGSVAKLKDIYDIKVGEFNAKDVDNYADKKSFSAYELTKEELGLSFEELKEKIGAKDG